MDLIGQLTGLVAREPEPTVGESGVKNRNSQLERSKLLESSVRVYFTKER